MRILVMLLLDTLPMLGNVLLLCFFVFFCVPENILNLSACLLIFTFGGSTLTVLIFTFGGSTLYNTVNKLFSLCTSIILDHQLRYPPLHQSVASRLSEHNSVSAPAHPDRTRRPPTLPPIVRS